MSKAKTYKLLPCPFCGHPPVVRGGYDRLSEYMFPPQFAVLCIHIGCGAAPEVMAATQRRAVAMWNTRDGKAL